MVRIIMHGCNGKMGQAVSGLLAQDQGAQLVAGVDLRDGGHNPYPVFRDIGECDVEADCLIDFSIASAVDGVLDYCVRKKLPCVICTTGLTPEQKKKMEEASKSTAVLHSANMLLGVNLLLKLLKSAAAILAPAGYDIEIVEKHHNQKVDAPSGTALALADAINKELEKPYDYVYDRSKRKQARPRKEIGISVVRGGTIVGDHDVIFAGPDEVVTFSHRAYSKTAFGQGAIQAAKFLAGKAPGLYSMEDVIQLTEVRR